MGTRRPQRAWTASEKLEIVLARMHELDRILGAILTLLHHRMVGATQSNGPRINQRFGRS